MIAKNLDSLIERASAGGDSQTVAQHQDQL